MSDFEMPPPPPPTPPPPPPPPFPTFTEPPPMNGPTRSGPAWEQPGETVTRFINTAKAVLLDPQNTFGTMRREGGLQLPLTYYLLGAVIGAIFTYLWTLVLPGWGGMGHSPMFSGVMLIPLSLIFGLIGVFLWSGIVHVVLGLFGGQNFPYETTFRVMAYAAGSTSPLAVIPSCGGFIAGIWMLVVVVIGLAQAQETTIGKAAAAVIVPAVLCCGLIFITITMLGVAAGVAGSMIGR